MKTKHLLLLLLCAACSAGPAVAPEAQAPVPAASDPQVQPARAALSYELFLTGGAQADDELPLVVAIHGLGSRPERFQGLYQDFSLPARVVLPLAPTPTANGGGSWYPFRRGETDQEARAARIHSAAQLVAELLDSLPQEHPTRGLPVVTGFSQGGMLSFALAADWPERISAALPIGGGLPEPLLPSAEEQPERLPTIVAFHGEDDDVVPYAPAAESIAALALLGYPARMHSYPGLKHSISAELREDYYAQLALVVGGDEP